MMTSYEKITKNIAIIMTHSVCTNEVEFRGEKVPEYFFETGGTVAFYSGDLLPFPNN